jgi:hypothetical protein
VFGEKDHLTLSAETNGLYWMLAAACKRRPEGRLDLGVRYVEALEIQSPMSDWHPEVRWEMDVYNFMEPKWWIDWCKR